MSSKNASSVDDAESLKTRRERLWRSHTAQFEFVGEDSLETRPSFMGAVRDFLTENQVGTAVKRVFFAGMAALALSSAMAAPVQSLVSVDHGKSSINFVDKDDNLNKSLNTDRLFVDQGNYDKVFKAFAEDFSIELVSGDVKDLNSMENYADNLLSKGISKGVDLANSIVDEGNARSPVVMQFFSGAEVEGSVRTCAAITYNGDHNPVLAKVFGSLEQSFGADVNHAIEQATWIHETMHAIIGSSEQSGLEAWKTALSGDFKPYEDWRNSVEGQVSYPEIRDVLDREVDVLRQLYGPNNGDVPLEYDAGRVIEQIKNLKETDLYDNFQENMADGLMSAKFLQDGYSISADIAESRGARANVDPIHDTSIGQRAIGHLTQQGLSGLSARELVGVTARVVQDSMGFSSSGIDFERSELDRGVGSMERLVYSDHQDQEKTRGQSEPLAGVVHFGGGQERREFPSPGVDVQHGSLVVERQQVGRNEHLVRADKLRTRADALKFLNDVVPANTQDGHYLGKAVVTGVDHWVQHGGRGSGVLHDVAKFDKVPAVGDVCECRYQDGRANLLVAEVGRGAER